MEPGPVRPVAGELIGQAYVRNGDWKLVAAHAPDGSPPRRHRCASPRSLCAPGHGRTQPV